MTILSKPFTGAVVFALLWVALAVASPTTTFHLAPVIVAAWPAVARPRRRDTVTLAVLGLALVAVTTATLAATGHLAGPSLLPAGGPAAESMLGALAGAVVGLVVGSRPDTATAAS